MLQLFQNSFIFGEPTYSHFFRVTTSTQQLLFRSSYFFRAAAFFEALLFQNCHFSRTNYFFRIATFSEQNFYRAVTFWERRFFKAVTFRNSYLFGGEVQKSYFFQADTSAQYQLFQESYILEKSNFLEN